MYSIVAASCAFVSNFGGKPVQNHWRNVMEPSALATGTTHTSRLVVRKAISNPQFHRGLYPSLSTAILPTFSDQPHGLCPLSTGPTISTDKVNEYIVERSC